MEITDIRRRYLARRRRASEQVAGVLVGAILGVLVAWGLILWLR